MGPFLACYSVDIVKKISTLWMSIWHLWPFHFLLFLFWVHIGAFINTQSSQRWLQYSDTLRGIIIPLPGLKLRLNLRFRMNDIILSDFNVEICLDVIEIKDALYNSRTCLRCITFYVTADLLHTHFCNVIHPLWSIQPDRTYPVFPFLLRVRVTWGALV